MTRIQSSRLGTTLKAGVLLIAFICLLLSSCSKQGMVPATISINTANVLQKTTLSSENNVSLDNIQDLLEKESALSKSTATLEYDITPYIGKSSDTLMYIVNFTDNNGWKIYSTDKRTPAILAEGEEGYFSLEDGSPAVAAWMSCVAEDIARVRRSTDDELTFSEDEIRANKAFWEGGTPTRDLDPPFPDLPPGHWEETTTSSIIVYDTLGHMVAHWDQDAPYNECSPFLINQVGTSAPAGCVAIAGSQVLLYLHNAISVPAEMFSEGICIGNTGNYQKSFANPTSTVWSSMSMDYQSSSNTTLPEAIMISFVGQRVGMHYSEIGNHPFSWALPGNLKTNLFEYYGFSCSRGSYNETIVKNSLSNQMPVIVSATNQLIPSDFEIHCFVIDGYRMTQKKYTHHHVYVLDEQPENPYIMPVLPDYTTYTYDDPEITSIKINWGWASQWYSQPVNDGWYSLTEGWMVTNNGTYDYNYNRPMTYGFAVAD